MTEKNEIKELIKATDGLLEILNLQNRELRSTLERQKKIIGRIEGNFFILNK